jgi:pyruvate-formate lyase
VMMLSTCATIATIQGHVILEYDRVLEKGLLAMREEIREAMQQGDGEGEEADFLRSLEIALEGVMIYSTRLAEKIQEEIARGPDPRRRATLEEMLARCRQVPLLPARSFEEAVQCLWTVKTAVELAHPVNLHCFGRLDQSLYPYYRKDLEEGRITREKARERLEELLLKIMSQNIRPESNLLGNFYHRYLGSSPVTVGGLRPDGEDGTNELTALFIEASHRSRAVTNMSVRVHEKTPDELLLQVADSLYEGTSSYSLFSDEINIEAMMRRGFSEADARDYAIMGCVETTCPGKTGHMSACALLLNRLLDMVLRNGDSAILAGTIHGEGPRTGDPDGFADFDAFLEALQKQAAYAIEKIVEGCNIKDRLYAEHLPAPLISAFMDGCFETKKDVTRGGAVYDLAGISTINSIANLVDSLLVIKKFIFEEKKLDFKTLLEAVDNDFRGHEDLLLEIRNLPGKWGNGDPETDALAARVTKALFSETYKYRNYKGGPFTVFAISMITHTLDGRLSIASPDGRRAASPYAASCNPYNVEKAGVTAALRSVAALPYEDMMGCAVNMKFHPSGIGETRQAREKWLALIRTYFQIGGSQIQPTVASAEMLKEAQSDPERHMDLIVKVGGYSTYFVDLGREIQDEVIARTEHL